ncbi:MAG: FAD-binding oxidoreductase [Chloroflexota bacterium]
MKSLTRPTPTSKTAQYITDYLVIGKGLFGSAAAYHLSKLDAEVLLVGSDEPANWSTHTGVFASHYDEGRIVSQSAPDEDLAFLDRASIAAYDGITRESGISFFVSTGRLTAQPEDQPVVYPYLAPNDTACHRFARKELEDQYPFRIPFDYSVVYEDPPSGHLNPRAMVRAQIVAAQKRGIEVISGLVTEILNRNSYIETRLKSGETIHSQKVLIATGAFANCFGLLGEKLAIRAENLTTILCEVSEETAVALRSLPPLNYRQFNHPLIHTSVLPPVPYPDGRYFIKLSLTTIADRLLPNFEAMSTWFCRSQAFPYLAETKALMLKMLPSIEILSWHIKPCIAAYTPSQKPMIDVLVDGRIYVAVGGNAGSAHPSHAIGKLAADLLHHNRWRSELDHKPFQLQYAADWHDWMTGYATLWLTDYENEQ